MRVEEYIEVGLPEYPGRSANQSFRIHPSKLHGWILRTFRQNLPALLKFRSAIRSRIS